MVQMEKESKKKKRGEKKNDEKLRKP